MAEGVVINYANSGEDTPIRLPEVYPTPNLPRSGLVSNDLTYVKQAPKDTIVFDESSVTPEALLELYFEDLGGIELANLSRADAIDGQDVTYSPIKNLSSLRRRFNPNNIIASAGNLESYFARFAIDLLQRGIEYPYVTEDGNVAIEISTILSDEEIEIQVLSSGTIDRIEQ